MKTNTTTPRIVFLIAMIAAVSSRADTISWTNSSGGNWSVAANWAPNQVPGSSDDVVITAGGIYTVTLDASLTVNSLTLGGAAGRQTLNNSGNDLTVNNPSAVDGNGVLFFSGGRLTGAVTVVGALNWSGGSLWADASLTVATNGVLNITGTVGLGSALTNEGTVNWQAGGVEIANGSGYTGAIWNQAGALWDIQCDQALFFQFGGEQFYNFGTLRKSAGTGTATFTVFLANSGTVQAESGTIQFCGGSDLGGTFQADASAAICFTCGNYTLSGPPNFQGPGPVRIKGGTVTLANFVGTLDLDGANLAGQSTLSGGTLNWNSGQLNPGASLTVGTNAVLNITGSVLVEGALTVNGTLNWNSGQLSPGASLTVATNGVLNILGSVLVEGALTNAGTVRWQAGMVEVIGVGGGGSGAIWNGAGGRWDIQCDQILSGDYGAQFYNAGLVQKTGGTNTTSFNMYLHNSGAVRAESGTIQFNGGSELGGIFQADAGAVICFGGGSYTLSSTPNNFQGPGPVKLTAGSSITLSNFVGTFDLDGPSLAGQSILFSGTLNWNSGLLDPGASLTVATNGVLNITGSVLVEGALTNAGTVNWQAGMVEVIGVGDGGSGAIWNEAGGRWDIQCDQTLAGDYGAQFYNAGLVQKTGGTNTTSFDMYLHSTGAVHAVNGTLQLNGGSELGGTFQADASAVICFGGGSFTLSSPPDFQGPGPVQLKAGSSVTLSNFIGTLELDGASLDGQSTLSGGTLNWNSGQLNNGASLTVATSGVLNIEGAVSLSGVLTNQGTVNWQAGSVVVVNVGGGGSGAIWNEAGGRWDIQCDQTLAGGHGSQFYNAGLVQKTGGTNTTSFDYLYCQNSGTVEADTGTISFQGGYSDSSSADLSISLGGAVPGSAYGRISFSTPLVVSGTFSVSTRNGFLPSAGNSFQVLSYPSATNQFDCLRGLDLGGGILLQPQFSSSGLTLLAAAYTTNASRPQLFINRTLGGMAITWPLGFPGWTLQSATNLSSQAWVSVSNTCGNQALVPINMPQQYFRLKQNN